MIKSKKDYKFYIEADKLISGRERNFLSLDRIGKFQFLLRKVEYYQNCRRDFFGKLLLQIYKYRFKKLSILLGFSIPTNVFGPGLYIPHYGTIVVNPNARVGSNCVLHTCVCIAGNESKIIGNNVYLSTGVVLSGSIAISDNITIGANSFVNKDFNTSNKLIGGSPAKELGERKSWFIEDGEKYYERVNKIENLRKAFYKE